MTYWNFNTGETDRYVEDLQQVFEELNLYEDGVTVFSERQNAHVGRVALEKELAQFGTATIKIGFGTTHISRKGGL